LPPATRDDGGVAQASLIITGSSFTRLTFAITRTDCRTKWRSKGPTDR